LPRAEFVPDSSNPLELAVDGLLELVEEQAGVEALGGVWVFPTMPRPIELPQRRDAVVQVKGNTLKASTAAPKVRVSTRVNVVGCEEDDEGLIMAMAMALLEEHAIQRIVDRYRDDEEPDEREELLSAMESLEDQVERLEAEVRRLRKKGS
jgi:hypothetical protein